MNTSIIKIELILFLRRICLDNMYSDEYDVYTSMS